MFDSSSDGWGSAFVQIYVDGNFVESLSLLEGGYEFRNIGLGVDCEENSESLPNIELFNLDQLPLQIFPNPGNSTLIIHCSKLPESSTLIQFFDTNGRMIMDLTNQNYDLLGNIKVDVSSLTFGI